MSFLTYTITIHCEVNEHGKVIPTGSTGHVTNEEGSSVDMLLVPEWWKIAMIWIGTYFRFPDLKTKE